MLVSEILEGVVPIFGRSGNKSVRKYRCTSGSRKGRIVAKPSTCTAPKSVSKTQRMKKTRAKKGSSISVKSGITKRTNPYSKRLSKVNTGRRRIKPKRRSGKRRRI